MGTYFLVLTILAIMAVIYTSSIRVPISNYDGNIILKSKNRAGYLIFASIVLVSIIGLRDPSVGADTYAYMLEYNADRATTISDLDISLGSDFGYRVITILFSKLHIPWQVFLLLVSLFIVVVFVSFVRDNCLLTFLPLFLYITIGNFVVNMTALRQSIALTLCLLAYKKITQHKLLLFGILVVLAASIHYSALVFVVVILFTKLQLSKRIQLFIWLILPIFIRALSGVLYQLLIMFAPERYIGNGYFSDLNLTLNVLAELVPLTILLGGFILLFTKKIEKINQRDYHFYIFTSLYACMYELTHTVYMAGRLSFYFSPFVIVFISNSIRTISDKHIRLIVYLLTYSLCIVFFAITIPGSSYKIDTYMFFWK